MTNSGVNEPPVEPISQSDLPEKATSSPANQKVRFRDARASQFRLHSRQPVARINNFLRLFFRPLIIKHKFSCRAKSNASALERIATSDRDGMHRATCAAAGTIYLGPGFAFSVTLALITRGQGAKRLKLTH